jgi:Tol biopolymer transport system component
MRKFANAVIFSIGFLGISIYGNSAQSVQSSPSKIAFVQDVEIYVMDDDGSDIQQITHIFPAGPTEHLSWSPDGKTLLFDAIIPSSPESSKSDYDIYSVSLDSHEVRRLTSYPADEVFPVWAPQGDKIAFVSNKDGNWDIYVMDVDGSNILKLTSNSADDGFHGIAWSPDGSKIAFVSDRDQGTNEKTQRYEAENIYLINVQNTLRDTESQVTNLTTQIDMCPAGEFYRNLSWSIQNQLAFSLGCGISTDIYSATFNGDSSAFLPELRRLTNAETFYGAFGLDWSPDGNRLVFVTSNDNSTPYDRSVDMLNFANTDKSTTHQFVQLTSHPSNYLYPVWNKVVQ